MSDDAFVKQYQDEAFSFAADLTEIHPRLADAGLDEIRRMMELQVYALGLTGEAGEAADLIKKHVGHGHPLDETKLKKELGDVLWYIAAICKLKGYSMSTIMVENITKLRGRYGDARLTREASINRKE